MKKGQIQFFVIVGSILLLIVMLFLLAEPRVPYQQPLLGKEEILRTVEECLKQSVRDQLIAMGRQGRLFPAETVYTSEGPLAVFVYKGKILLPPQKDLEIEVALGALKGFDVCIDDLASLPGEISRGDATIDIVAGEEALVARAVMHLTYTRDEKEVTFSEFRTTIPFAFTEVYSNVEQVVQLFAAEQLDITKLAAMPGQVKLTPLDEAMQVTLIYNILDDEPYQYSFAVKP